jgi:chromosome partitioning protein
MEMRTIAIANHKGGCGKTTTATNLAAASAMLGKRVLLIDLDPQAHTTIGLAYAPETVKKSIGDVLINPQISISEAAKQTDIEWLKFVPGSISLANTELEMGSILGKQFVLAERLRTVRDEYDFCIIDCLPSLGLLTVNALVASTDVIVPVQVHYYALEGLTQLIETIHIVRERFYPCFVKILGMLLTFVEDRPLFTRQIQQQLRASFGNLVFNTVIHKCIRLTEAPSFGRPVLTHAPESRAAAEYEALSKEVISRIQTKELVHSETQV